MGALSGRVAVVTGGAGGIGLATVKRLSALGATCWIWDRTTSAAAEALGPTRIVDVTNAADIRAAVDEVVMASGSLDVMVTAAGIALHGSSLETAPSDWTRILDVNASGTFWCAREAARVMSGKGGSIVAIGSISGMVSNTPQAQTAYNASKAAVHTMVKCLAVEFAPVGVRVNAVAPGFVDTKLLDGTPPLGNGRNCR